MDAIVKSVERLIPAKKIDIFGKDSLMNSSLPYYLMSLIIGYGAFSVWDNAWSLLFITYTLLPALDEIFSHDLRNPTEE
jgi:alkane 1-monooxygenase